MKRKTSRRVAGKTAADKAYTAWVHTQPCVGLYADPGHECDGPIEQSHGRNLDGMTGLGRKAPDRDSVAMCRSLHVEWEQRAGWFYDWPREMRRVWMQKRILEANARYDAEQASQRSQP